jgi:hypothetical protein
MRKSEPREVKELARITQQSGRQNGILKKKTWGFVFKFRMIHAFASEKREEDV